jgi:nitroreductase
VFLQAVSLDLGTLVIGAFNNDGVKKALNFETDEYPLYIMPIGRLPNGK